MSETPRPTTRPAKSFEFVTVASARARQLLKGCVPKVDGSPKPSVAVVEAFAGARRLAGPDECPWIDLEPEEFLVEPNVELQRLYARYRTSARAGAANFQAHVAKPFEMSAVCQLIARLVAHAKRPQPGATS